MAQANSAHFSFAHPSLTPLIIEVTEIWQVSSAGMAEHCSAQATDILRKPSKRGGLCPLASPSSTVFPRWLPWPTLHLLVRLLENCSRWVTQYGTWAAPSSFHPPSSLHSTKFLISDIIYLSLSDLFFLWLVGSTETPLYQSREKKLWWSNLYCCWGNCLDIGLGGVKDGLLTIAFIVICDC